MDVNRVFEIILKFAACAALPTLRQGLLSWVAPTRPTFFVTKKGSEKSLAVARQRTPPKGARPLGTPAGGSVNEKTKNCRSAAIFLTFFHRPPY